MNRFAKGSLAAGAGIVLLMGGAGTLAYWNSEIALTGGTVQAGTLTLEQAGAVDGVAPAMTVGGADLLVPGGQARTFSTDMVLTATGADLSGTVELAPATEQLLTDLSATHDVEVTIGDPVETGTAWTVTDVPGIGDSAAFSGPGTFTFPVTVSIALPADADDTAQGVSVVVDSIELTATQTAPDIAPAA